MKLRVHVRYRSDARRTRWEAQQTLNPDLTLDLKRGRVSLCRLVNELLTSDDEAICLVCHEDVLLPRDFARRIGDLVHDLDSAIPDGWAAVSNLGLSFNGVDRYRYFSPIGSLSRSIAPMPVAHAGEDVLLLNLRNLRREGVTLPSFRGRPGHGIVLSLEAMRRGLACLVDSRLHTFRESPEEEESARSFLRGEIFGDYFTARFVNHAFITYYGVIDFSQRTDYRFLDYRETSDRLDLHQLYADVAASVTRSTRPSVTVVCRTRFDRPAMIERTIRSIAIARTRCAGLAVQARIVVAAANNTDFTAELERLEKLAGGLPIALTTVPPSGRYPRTELMLEGFRGTHTDYVWFLDDDDFLTPDALRHLEAAINLAKNNFVIGDTAVYEEVWSGAESDPADRLARKRLNTWKPLPGYLSRDYLRSLTGTNFVPNCAIVYPVALMQSAIEGVAAKGDYNEDYFFLCLALASPNAEVALVHRPIAGISRHNSGNTVTEIDRSHWHESFVTFASELVNRPQAGSPVFWELGRSNASSLAALDHKTAQPRPPQLQLFVGDAGIFTEEGSISTTLDLGEHVQRRRMTLHGLSGDSLRLDLCERPALVQVETLNLCYFDGVGWRTHAWIEQGKPVRLFDTHGMVQVIDSGGATSRFVAVSADPQLLLHLPPDLAWNSVPELWVELSIVELPQLAARGLDSHSGSREKLAFLNSAPQELRMRRFEPATTIERSELDTHLAPQEHVFRFHKEKGERRFRLEFGDRPAFVDFTHLHLLVDTKSAPVDQVTGDGFNRTQVTRAEQMVPLPASDGMPRRWLVTAAGAYLDIAVAEELADLTGSAELNLALRYIPLPQLEPAVFMVAPQQAIQLYWPVSGTHSEENSTLRPLELGAGVQEHEFAFPYHHGGPLRLDLGDIPAFIDELDITLSYPGEDDDEKRFRWLLRGDSAPIELSNLMRLANTDEGMDRWFVTGPDAHLLLAPPGDALRSGPAELQVRLRYIALAELNSAAFTARSQRDIPQKLQLYIASNGAYSEAESLSCDLLLKSEPQEHTFTIDREVGTELRLDIGDVPALIELHDLEMVAGPAASTALNWCTASGKHQLRGAHNLVRLAAPALPQRWFVTGNDPFWQFDVPLELQRVPHSTVRVRLTYLPLSELRGRGFDIEEDSSQNRDRQLIKWHPTAVDSAGTVARPLTVGVELKEYRFALAGQALGPSRLEVGTVAAYIEIHHVTLRLPDGRAVREWKPAELQADPGTQVLSPAAAAFFAVVCLGRNPQIYLGATESPFVGPLELVVRLRYQPFT